MISGLKAQLTKGHTVAHTPTANFVCPYISATVMAVCLIGKRG
jgi:hypothetical protein